MDREGRVTRADIEKAYAGGLDVDRSLVHSLPTLEKSERKAIRLRAFSMTLFAGIIGLSAIFIYSRLNDMLAGIFAVALVVFAVNLLVQAIALAASEQHAPAKWVKCLYRGLLYSATAVIAVGGLVYAVQDSMMFHDAHDEASRVFLQSKPEYREVAFTASNGKTYHGVMRAATGEDAADGQGGTGMGQSVGQNDGRSDGEGDGQGVAPATETRESPLIIYFGGNGQVSYNAMVNNEKNDFWKYYSDYSLLCVDYEGYGLNEGQPHYLNMYEESLAIYDYAAALPDVDEKHIVVLGYSLGTGPAVYLAANRPVAGVVIQAPYANGHDLYNAMLPIFIGPMRLLEKQKLPSDEYAPLVTCDTLVIASRDDELVPFSSSERLARLFAGPTELFVLDGIAHNEIFGAPGVAERIHDFLVKVGDE